jgi:hypothetical protein
MTPLLPAKIAGFLDQNIVNAFPARTICPGTLNQNNIPNAMLLVGMLRIPSQLCWRIVRERGTRYPEV